MSLPGAKPETSERAGETAVKAARSLVACTSKASPSIQASELWECFTNC